VTHPLHERKLALEMCNFTPNIELRATRLSPSGEIEWCAKDEAMMFSVYAGVPGDYAWAADFADYYDALVWSKEIVARQGGELIDYVKETWREA
jgi:hypothetical protein